MYYRRVPGTASRPIDGTMIVVHVADAALITLNRTGGFVWSRLDGRRSEGDLVRELSGAGTCVRSEDLRGFLEDLRGRGLCEAIPAPMPIPDPALPLSVDAPESGESPAIETVEGIEAVAGSCSTGWGGPPVPSPCMTSPAAGCTNLSS